MASESKVKSSSSDTKDSKPAAVRPSIVGPALLSLAKEFCDVRLVLNDAMITSHRVVLAAASPVLADLIRRAPAGGSGELVQVEWKHAKFGAVYLSQLINSLYSGLPIAITAETALSWLELANLLDVASARFDAIEALTSTLTVDNCFEVINGAMGGSGTDALMSFVGPNIRKMVASPQWITLSRSALSWILASDDLVIDELELIKAAVAWGKSALAADGVAGATLQSIMAPFIGLLRFPLLDTVQMAGVVVPLNILTPEDTLILFQSASLAKGDSVGRFSARPRKVQPITLIMSTRTVSDGGNVTRGTATWIFDSNNEHKFSGFVDWNGYAHCPLSGEYNPETQQISWEEDFKKACNGDRNSVNTLRTSVAATQTLAQWLVAATEEQRTGRYESPDGGWKGTIYLSDVAIKE